MMQWEESAIRVCSSLIKGGDVGVEGGGGAEGVPGTGREREGVEGKGTRREEVVVKVVEQVIVPYEKDKLTALLSDFIQDQEIQVVITTGGTGVTGRDITPEVVRSLATHPCLS